MQLLSMLSFPNQCITTPILCHKHSLNVLTLEAELAPKQYISTNDEHAQNYEQWHPTDTKQNTTWMS